jgi:DNA polymerase (family 10)
LATGGIEKHREATGDIPDGLLDMLAIQGLGPKTLMRAHRELGVADLDGLKSAIEDGSLARLPGMGTKKAQALSRGVRLFERSRERIPLGMAVPLVEDIAKELAGARGAPLISAAGSLRRMCETVGDIDILAAAEPAGDLIDKFVHLSVVSDVVAAGSTKASIRTRDGIQVDLRVVSRSSYGAALQYFTGSKDHNVRLREMARAKGLKVNEYGVYRIADGEETWVAGEREDEIYGELGLPLIPPELREDRGEIEAAIENRLPDLVDEASIMGDIHVHSDYSDGTMSLSELAEAAGEMGYRYIAVCDHSPSVYYAGGLSVERLEEQIAEIRELNRRPQGVQLLAGSEVDILADGRLDLPDEILSKLDFVVASIHSGFKRDVTNRMIRAMRHPSVDTIGHPTGRLLSGREGYDVDMEAVMHEAAATGTALEINAYYDRLDLSDLHARRAKELGVKLSIGTDSHQLAHLSMMRFGIGVARRAWLGPSDILNAWPVEKIVAWRSSRPKSAKSQA